MHRIVFIYHAGFDEAEFYMIIQNQSQAPRSLQEKLHSLRKI